MITRKTMAASTLNEIIEAAALAYERELLAGVEPSLLAFCPPPDSPQHLAVFVELLRIEIELAPRLKGVVALRDLIARFPAQLAQTNILSTVAFEVYRQSFSSDHPVQALEFAEAFGIDVRDWPSTGEPESKTEIVPQMSVTASEPENRFPVEGEYFWGFRIEREIGRGSFARVYRAYQESLSQRPVAIKISQHFAEESQTLARLQHTNIVPIYSVHPAGEFQIVCMPYFGSTTLSHVMTKLHQHSGVPQSAKELVSTILEQRAATVSEGIAGDQPPKPDQTHEEYHSLNDLGMMTHSRAVLWIVSQLADALGHAHDRGVLHRDIKPANVLLADDGRPMLLDFNLSSVHSAIRSTIGGTPQYMSPEQLSMLSGTVATVDTRSDLYSLGLLLHELLGGAMPTCDKNATFQERVAHLLAERLQPLPAIRCDQDATTPAIQSIIRLCTHPDATRRYQSAYELREDLQRQLEHRPLKYATEPIGLERARKWSRRNPWVRSWAFFAALTLTFAGAAVTVASNIAQQRDQARRLNAIGEFEREYRRHRIALTTGDRLRGDRAIRDAEATLKRFGFAPSQPNEGGVLAPAMVAEALGDLYLLMALHELSGTQATRSESAQRWLHAAEALPLQAGQSQALTVIAAWQAHREQGTTMPTPNTAAERLIVAELGSNYRSIIQILDSQTVIQLKPLHWISKARAHRELGEWPEAIAAFTTAMALTGEPNADLLAVRGQTFLQSGDFSKAITDFDHVLEMNPDDTPARIDRAIAAIGARNYQAAIGDLDQAWHAIPTHSRILFIRARAKKLSGDAAGAKKDLETAMSLTPQDEESWLSHGMAHLNAGRPREALADFERVLADNPRSIEARLNKVAVLADHLQRLDDAIAILDEVLREVPENLAALAGRGVYLARLGRRDAAHADAKAVIARNPPPIYHYQIAGVYALTSKTHPADAEEAMTWLAKALQNGVGLEYVDSDPDLLPVKLSSKFRLLIAAARTLQQHHPSNENRE